jgi:SAM-dependent methyltransferase
VYYQFATTDEDPDMIEDIVREAATVSFDFRSFANPADPLANLFQEWVSYYRLKFAIAKVLKPRSILEIGVRFGYSARTFLEASPSAMFLGIDLDSDQFGGEHGALDWARQIMQDYDASFIVADSQKMNRLPEGNYDLIHVDGQQDGLGTFHDLRRAVSQAKWVLLDGYFWTRENFLNANDFVLKYKDVIDYASIIPGYGGELLIKVRESSLNSAAFVSTSRARTSSEIRQYYDPGYYLNSCGGFEAFRRSGGKQIQDIRHLVMLDLSRLTPARSALDLGCGRGEIAYQLALKGSQVTAVDYSDAAIELAKGCVECESDALRNRITFVCADASTTPFNQRYDLALAGDLIEHLSEEEVANLFANVAAHLEPGGVFIIHTYPNLWFYKYHHPRVRAAAATLGGFVPAEPRTRYELLMHINEQSPAGLRRQLRKAFAHVCVWVSRPEAPVEGLQRKFSRSELSASPDIYALASHAPLDLEAARRLLSQPQLPDYVADTIALELTSPPQEASPGIMIDLPVRVTNKSAFRISSMQPYPVHVSYHWYTSPAGELVIFEGLRTRLPRTIEPDETLDIVAAVQPPETPGDYRLAVTLVQEGCRWFEPANAAMCVTRVKGGSN